MSIRPGLSCRSRGSGAKARGNRSGGLGPGLQMVAWSSLTERPGAGDTRGGRTQRRRPRALARPRGQREHATAPAAQNQTRNSVAPTREENACTRTLFWTGRLRWGSEGLDAQKVFQCNASHRATRPNRQSRFRRPVVLASSALPSKTPAHVASQPPAKASRPRKKNPDAPDCDLLERPPDGVRRGETPSPRSKPDSSKSSIFTVASSPVRCRSPWS